MQLPLLLTVKISLPQCTTGCPTRTSKQGLSMIGLYLVVVPLEFTFFSFRFWPLSNHKNIVGAAVIAWISVGVEECHVNLSQDNTGRGGDYINLLIRSYVARLNLNFLMLRDVSITKTPVVSQMFQGVTFSCWYLDFYQRLWTGITAGVVFFVFFFPDL